MILRGFLRWSAVFVVLCHLGAGFAVYFVRIFIPPVNLLLSRVSEVCIRCAQMTPQARTKCVGRPRGITKVKPSLTMDADLAKVARKAAFTAGMSFSAFVEEAVRAQIKADAQTGKNRI